MSEISKNTDVPDLIIRSEQDVYELLDLAAKEKLPPYGNLIFDGWPTLNIYLKGQKFHQSITPTVMRGLLEFQKGIHQSYASAKYSSPTKRLTDEERRALEIRVDVKSGSSDYIINFQEIAEKIIQQLGGNMDQTHLFITVASIAAFFFGSSSLKTLLESRKEVQIKQISDETQRKTLETLSFVSEQETERSKIMANLIEKNRGIANIDRLAHDSRIEIVKTLTAGDSGSIQGVFVDPDTAESLTRNFRRKSSEVRLDGVYRLVKLDWTNPLKFRVKVFGIHNGLSLDAEVQDDSLTGKYKEALREAEWNRAPVSLKINAKLLGDDTYREVLVISAEKYVPEDQTK